MVTIYNPAVIAALQDLKEKGFGYAGVIKLLIRKYLKLGMENIPPANISDFLLRCETPPDILNRIQSEPQKQSAKMETRLKQERKTPKPADTQGKPGVKKRNPLLDLIE